MSLFRIITSINGNYYYSTYYQCTMVRLTIFSIYIYIYIFSIYIYYRVTRFRCSNHSLQIEVGRHQGLSKEERL